MQFLDKLLGREALPANCNVCKKRYQICNNFIAGPPNTYTFYTTEELEEHLPFDGAEITKINSVDTRPNDYARYAARYRCHFLKNDRCSVQLSPRLPQICRVKPDTCHPCPNYSKNS